MYRLSKTSLLGWITVWHSPCEITFVNEAILKDRQRREIGHPSPSFEILLTQNIDADSDNLWRFHHFYGDCLLLPVNSASPRLPRPSFGCPGEQKMDLLSFPRDNFFPTETDRSWVGVQTYVCTWCLESMARIGGIIGTRKDYDQSKEEKWNFLEIWKLVR